MEKKDVWSTSDIVNNRNNWSLAADAELLKHLQFLSENIFNKANSTIQSLNSFEDEVNQACISFANTNNKFKTLSDLQFIESKIQEEGIENPESMTAEDKDNSNAQVEDTTIKLKDALENGFKVLDTQYDIIPVNGSDSEDEEPQEILKARNPYLNRRLPYTIGTEEFTKKDHLGLIDTSSEDDDSEDEDDEDEEDIEQSEDEKVEIVGPRPLIAKTEFIRPETKVIRISSSDSEESEISIPSSRSSIKEDRITSNKAVPMSVENKPMRSPYGFAEHLKNTLENSNKRNVEHYKPTTPSDFGDIFSPPPFPSKDNDESSDEEISDNSGDIFSFKNSTSNNPKEQNYGNYSDENDSEYEHTPKLWQQNEIGTESISREPPVLEKPTKEISRNSSTVSKISSRSSESSFGFPSGNETKSVTEENVPAKSTPISDHNLNTVNKKMAAAISEELNKTLKSKNNPSARPEKVNTVKNEPSPISKAVQNSSRKHEKLVSNSKSELSSSAESVQTKKEDLSKSVDNQSNDLFSTALRSSAKDTASSSKKKAFSLFADVDDSDDEIDDLFKPVSASKSDINAKNKPSYLFENSAEAGTMPTERAAAVISGTLKSTDLFAKKSNLFASDSESEDDISSLINSQKKVNTNKTLNVTENNTAGNKKEYFVDEIPKVLSTKDTDKAFKNDEQPKSVFDSKKDTLFGNSKKEEALLESDNEDMFKNTKPSEKKNDLLGRTDEGNLFRNSDISSKGNHFPENLKKSNYESSAFNNSSKREKGLFDSDSDDNDLFGTPSAKKTVEKKEAEVEKSKIGNISGDEVLPEKSSLAENQQKLDIEEKTVESKIGEHPVFPTQLLQKDIDFASLVNPDVPADSLATQTENSSLPNLKSEETTYAENNVFESDKLNVSTSEWNYANKPDEENTAKYSPSEDTKSKNLFRGEKSNVPTEESKSEDIFATKPTNNIFNFSQNSLFDSDSDSDELFVENATQADKLADNMKDKFDNDNKPDTEEHVHNDMHTVTEIKENDTVKQTSMNESLNSDKTNVSEKTTPFSAASLESESKFLSKNANSNVETPIETSPLKTTSDTFQSKIKDKISIFDEQDGNLLGKSDSENTPPPPMVKSTPGKLAMNKKLNINVNALLPGANWSSKMKQQNIGTENEATPILSSPFEATTEVTKTPTRTKETSANGLLNTVTKQRAKVSTSRRPPTRRGRKSQLVASDIFADTTVGEGNESLISDSKENRVAKEHAKEIVEQVNVPRTDLRKTAITEAPKEAANLFESNDESDEIDDLFGKTSKSGAVSNIHVHTDSSISDAQSVMVDKINSVNSRTILSHIAEDKPKVSPIPENTQPVKEPHSLTADEFINKHSESIVKNILLPKAEEIITKKSPAPETQIQIDTPTSIARSENFPKVEENPKKTDAIAELSSGIVDKPLDQKNVKTQNLFAKKLPSTYGNLFDDAEEEDEDLFKSVTKETKKSADFARKIDILSQTENATVRKINGTDEPVKSQSKIQSISSEGKGKSNLNTKKDIFDDEDDDDELFASAKKKLSISKPTTKNFLFDDNEDTDLFSTKSSISANEKSTDLLSKNKPKHISNITKPRVNKLRSETVEKNPLSGENANNFQ